MPRSISGFILAVLMSSVLLACAQQKLRPVPQPPAPESAAPAAIDPAAAIASSADSLSREVQSGRAVFSWLVEGQGLRVQGNGTYAVQAPGNLQLETHYQGQATSGQPFREANDSSVLVLGGRIFLKTPPLGPDWVVFSPQEFGTDWSVVQRLIGARSPLNYSVVTAALEGITSAGSEVISGGVYLHLKATINAEPLMNALADTYGSQGQVMFVRRYTGNVGLDIWLDPETTLLKRLRADGPVTLNGVNSRLTLQVDYSDLNGVDKFAAAPQRFKTLADLR